MWSPVCEIYEESNRPKIDRDEAKDLLDKIYDIAYDEAFKDAYKNVVAIVENRKKRNELANHLYDSVEYQDIEKLIRKNLPLRVRLFNKITVTGKRINGERIIYTYHFNNDWGYVFMYEPLLDELEQLIK